MPIYHKLGKIPRTRHTIFEKPDGKGLYYEQLFGTIGFETLNKIVHHPQLQDLPKILETPFVGEDKKNKKAPYRFELDMLKSQTFNPGLLEDILNQ